jgi:hypothetical protein
VESSGDRASVRKTDRSFGRGSGHGRQLGAAPGKRFSIWLSQGNTNGPDWKKSSGVAPRNRGSCDAFGSSWTFLFLLKSDNLSGFPRRISCRVFGSEQKNRPEVTTHADVTSYKSEQKHDRNLLPQSLGRGDVNLGTPAVRTVL